MRDMKIRKMVLAALMAALTYVATMVVQIPSPMQGFVNLGDCFVLLSGWLLGPWYGFAAGGIGSISKILSGAINPSGRLVDTYVHDNLSSAAMQLSLIHISEPTRP